VRVVGSETLRKLEHGGPNVLSKVKSIFLPSELSCGIPGYSDEMERVVNEEIENRKYDLTFFCGFSTFIYCSEKNRRRPCLVDGVDSFSLFCKSVYLKEKRIVQRMRGFMNFVWAIRYERMHFSKAKNMIFTSPVDRNYVMKNAPASRIWVVPNGVDLAYFKDAARTKPTKGNLLFTGVMDYAPNNDSIIYFVLEILPRIRKELPYVTLTVVGKNPTRELRSLAEKTEGIEVTGLVPDIRPFFEQSEIYVAPMISGAGIKNKILEAWAMMKPTVATPMSCNGLEAVDRENILVAERADEFAARTVEVLRDPLLSAGLASKGRRTVETYYSWEEQSAKLKRVFEEVTTSQTP
jgi:glycosyltransferase involved in cell wall biosynthesis